MGGSSCTSYRRQAPMPTNMLAYLLPMGKDYRAKHQNSKQCEMSPGEGVQSVTCTDFFLSYKDSLFLRRIILFPLPK